MAIKSYDLVIALTGGGPGRATELPATFMYSYTFTRNQMGVGAASAVIMLMMIASIIIPYLYAELRAAAVAHSEATAVKPDRLARAVIYAALILFAIYFLLPLFVMLVNSVKPLAEIRGGNMLALPQEFTVAPWLSAWGTAQIGVEPTGLKPYLNSIKMVVPAVDLDAARRAERLRPDQVALSRRQSGVRHDAARLLHPVPDRADPDGAHPRPDRAGRHHLGPRAGARGLRPRLHHAVLSQLLRGVPIRADQGGTDRRRRLLPDLPSHPAAELGPIIVVTVIWQFTNIWNDFLFGASFADFDSMPMTVALNNLVSSSTGVKEYNVHFAGAVLAALPTLVVYIVSGRYFVRGLMAGAVKG